MLYGHQSHGVEARTLHTVVHYVAQTTQLPARAQSLLRLLYRCRDPETESRAFVYFYYQRSKCFGCAKLRKREEKAKFWRGINLPLKKKQCLTDGRFMLCLSLASSCILLSRRLWLCRAAASVGTDLAGAPS